MFGYSIEEADGRQASELLVGRHTDRRALARLRRRIERGSRRRGGIPLLRQERRGNLDLGQRPDVPQQVAGGSSTCSPCLTDITETKQLRSLQQLIMTALADEIPITDIADQLCRRVEEIAPDVVSSLLHIDAGGLIHPLGGPSLPEDYSQALDGVAIGPDIGSCGSAAFYGKAVLAIDLDTDPRWQPFKTRPLEVGLRACWSSPIKAKDGRVIGTFAFYFRECRPPSAGISALSTPACISGALAIERKEARAQIARLAYYDTLTGLPNRARLRRSDLRGDSGLSRRKARRAGVSRCRQFQGRQRYARTFGRRRIAGRVRPAPARADSAGRRTGASGRRRIRDRAAES